MGWQGGNGEGGRSLGVGVEVVLSVLLETCLTVMLCIGGCVPPCSSLLHRNLGL